MPSMFADKTQYRILVALVVILLIAAIRRFEQSASFVTIVAYAQAPRDNSVQAPPETTITSNTELVQVPVVVRKGKDHVSGLTQADFTVLDGGHRQKLAFAKLTGTGVVLKHVVGENVYSNQLDTAGEAPRLTVFVIDSANMPFADQAQVRDSFRKFLASDAANRGPTAVVSFERSGVRVVRDFTSDPNELAAVMDYGFGSKRQARTSQTTGGVSDPKVAKQSSAQQGPILGILPRATYDPIHGDDDPVLAAKGLQFHDLEAKNLQLRDLVELELRGLDMLAQSLAGVPGRKTLIWLTGNFPFDLDNPNSYLSPSAYTQNQIVTPHGGTGRDGLAVMPNTPAFQVPSTSLIGTAICRYCARSMSRP